MAAPLAASIFVAGPKDILAVADVYKQTGKSIVNSFQDLAANVSAGVLGALKSAAAKDINALINAARSAESLVTNPNALLRMSGIPATAGSVVSNAQSAIGSALNSVESSVAGALSVVPNLVNSVTATVNGVTSTVLNAGAASLNSVTSLISSATNVSISITDKGATAGFISGLSTQASSMGIPGTFSALSSLAKGDASILLGAASVALPNAIKTANYNLISDITNTIGSSVNSIIPNFSKAVVSNFTIPNGTPSSQYGTLLSQVNGTCTAANSNYNTTSIGDISAFNGYNSIGSDDYSSLVSTSCMNDTIPVNTATLYTDNSNASSYLGNNQLSLISNTLGPSNPTTDLSTNYPGVALNSPTTSTTPTVSPSSGGFFSSIGNAIYNAIPTVDAKNLPGYQQFNTATLVVTDPNALNSTVTPPTQSQIANYTPEQQQYFANMGYTTTNGALTGTGDTPSATVSPLKAPIDPDAMSDIPGYTNAEVAAMKPENAQYLRDTYGPNSYAANNPDVTTTVSPDGTITKQWAIGTEVIKPDGTGYISKGIDFGSD